MNTLTDADSMKAKNIWSEYLQNHDVSDRTGQTAGIDPKSGRIWFGKSIIDIVNQQKAEGVFVPLFLNGLGFHPIIENIKLLILLYN